MSVSRWFWIFFKSSIIFATGFVALVIFAGIWPPIYSWLMIDAWHWMPINIWFRYAIGGFTLGFEIGALFTLYIWLQQTSASLLVKTLTAIFTIAGASASLFVSVSLTKYFIPV